MLIAEKCVTEFFFAFLKIEIKNQFWNSKNKPQNLILKNKNWAFFLYGKNQPIKWDEKKKRIFKNVKKTDFVQCFSMCVKMIIKET